MSTWKWYICVLCVEMNGKRGCADVCSLVWTPTSKPNLKNGTREHAHKKCVRTPLNIFGKSFGFGDREKKNYFDKNLAYFIRYFFPLDWCLAATAAVVGVLACNFVHQFICWPIPIAFYTYSYYYLYSYCLFVGQYWAAKFASDNIWSTSVTFCRLMNK